MYITVKNDNHLKVLLKEIFTDDFMRQYTNFQSFEYFKYSSAVICNWEADEMVYDEVLLTMFIKESTQFESFDEMVKKATNLHFINRTGLEKKDDKSFSN